MTPALITGAFAERVDLKSKTSIDDPLDVFPCHGIGGVMGMILTGVVAKEVGLLAGPTTTFYKHLIARVPVGSFSFFGAYILYTVFDLISPLRVSVEEEEIGLDLSQHLASIDTPERPASIVPQNAIKNSALSFL